MSVYKFKQIFTTDLHEKSEGFFQGCQEKSELCLYFRDFQKIAVIIKQLITSDHDGRWPLLVGTVKASMGILREFDAVNYLPQDT